MRQPFAGRTDSARTEFEEAVHLASKKETLLRRLISGSCSLEETPRRHGAHGSGGTQGLENGDSRPRRTGYSTKSRPSLSTSLNRYLSGFVIESG